MSSGPEERQPAEKAQAEETPLPGGLVSDELHSDCARFLDELQRLVQARRESAAAREARP